MAEVFRARMMGVEGFQKTVAIKRILADMAGNDEFVTMFIDEAKLAAQLKHPNIVDIYDLGKIERSFYIAMEYVEVMTEGGARSLPRCRRDRAGAARAPLRGQLASALDTRTPPGFRQARPRPGAPRRVASERADLERRRGQAVRLRIAKACPRRPTP